MAKHFGNSNRRNRTNRRQPAVKQVSRGLSWRSSEEGFFWRPRHWPSRSLLLASCPLLFLLFLELSCIIKFQYIRPYAFALSSFSIADPYQTRKVTWAPPSAPSPTSGAFESRARPKRWCGERPGRQSRLPHTLAKCLALLANGHLMLSSAARMMTLTHW